MRDPSDGGGHFHDEYASQVDECGAAAEDQDGAAAHWVGQPRWVMEIMVQSLNLDLIACCTMAAVDASIAAVASRKC